MSEEGGEEGGAGGGEEREPVPYKRFQGVVAKKNELASRVKELEGEIQSLSEKGATVDSINARFTEAETGYKSQISKLQESLQLSDNGIRDEDGRDIARLYFGREDKATREKGIGAWLSQFTGEEGAPEPPKALGIFLPKSAPAAPETPKGGGFPRPPRPGTQGPASGGGVDKAAVHQALANGDRTAFLQMVPGLSDLLKPAG